MEGLIPFVYRAIVQYKTGGQIAAGSWFCESPSASNYMRLPGDSGRFQASGIHMFQPDRVFSSTTSSSSPSTCMATPNNSSTSSAQSPLCRSNSRRLTAIS